jgi:metal-responsive CopG/Arc/MetJ family transcriptional regulator
MGLSGMISSHRGSAMATAVKKTISLPRDLAREAEQLAKAEGKTLSGVIQDALRAVRAKRINRELGEIQGFWSRKAKEKGILSERDLQKYLDS